MSDREEPKVPRVVKLQRAHGGYLGAISRRRTREAAIVYGELSTSVDPYESEWGNPTRVKPGYGVLNP